MDLNLVTAVSTAVTAVGALLLIGLTLWIEYSRRRYDCGQVHLQHLREYVLQPLTRQLTAHYLPILERQDVLVQIRSEAGTSTYDPESGRVILWKAHLVLKDPPAIFSGPTFGDPQQFFHYETTFPYLYDDAKTCHFQEFFKRWEHLGEQVRKLGEESLSRCAAWQTQLKERLQFIDVSERRAGQPWADYLKLTSHLFGLLWCKYPNAPVLFQSAGQWTLQSQGNELAQGDQHQMILCREVIAEVVRLEEKSMENLFEQADCLKREVLSIKEELEQLLLRQQSLGPCAYVRIPIL
jgi:hypothetical protein